MTKAKIDTNQLQSWPTRLLKCILLVICLCVLALRTTYAEGPPNQSANQLMNITDVIFSLSMSAVLLLSAAVWLLYSLWKGKLIYRFTALEVGLGLFCIAAVVASLNCSNKRAAITETAVLIAPILMAVLLVQLLDSLAKIKLVLAVVVALGVVSTSQCVEQSVVSNRAIVTQYEQDPASILEPLGIKQGSFQHMLLEHRLYSSDVRGFFTTGNSAGSFAILALFPVVGLLGVQLSRRKCRIFNGPTFIALGLTGITLAGLVITRSKGAILASVIAAIIFIAAFRWAPLLQANRKKACFICLLIVVVCGLAVSWYGIEHGRLPGGNSMLVRWQYWRASAEMYADHPLTGVGPGNFAYFYTHYKPASAPETVANPHSFILAILSQYGPLGLIGFLVFILLPLYKACKPAGSSVTQIKGEQTSYRRLACWFGVIIAGVLLILRPMIFKIQLTNTPAVPTHLILTTYVTPVMAFVAGFILLGYVFMSTETSETRLFILACFCACVGVVIHNLVDFAVFEPGVFTCFCVIIACLVALDFRRRGSAQLVFRPILLTKTILTFAILTLVWAFLSYVFMPVVNSTIRVALANKLYSQGLYKESHQLLTAAAETDPFDPIPFSLNGRFYLNDFKKGDSRQGLLMNSGVSLLEATHRNPVDYKNYERLANVYLEFAQLASGTGKNTWLKKALDAEFSAVERYPCSGRLRFQLAQIAEKLIDTNLAIEQYKKAVEIEDSYREQFRVMYPHRQVFSRLGEEKYQLAKKRMTELSVSKVPSK